MANTAPLSPDELAKKQKAVEGQIKTSMAKDIANAGFMGGRGLPSAPPADITKAARPLTGGASTPPPSEVGGMGPSTPPPATHGFTPPAVAAETKAANLPSYIRPSEDLTKRLTPPNTSSIPEGDGGTKSNIAAKYQDGQLIKVDMSQDQARKEGAQVVTGVDPSTRGAYIDPNKAEQLKKGMTKQADATGEFLSGLVAGAKKVYDQATAKPDYGKGFRDTNRYRK